MRDGRIVEHGTHKELLARGVDFHATLDSDGAAAAAKPAITAAHSSPSPSAASAMEAETIRASARAASAAAEVPQAAPDLAQQPEAPPPSAQHAADEPGYREQAAVDAPAGPALIEAPERRGQTDQAAPGVSDAESSAHAVDGEAAAERADGITSDLVPLLAPTITGGAVPEAASGALTAATPQQGRDTEPRGWRGEDGKVAGGRSGSRKGRLVYVRLP